MIAGCKENSGPSSNTGAPREPTSSNDHSRPISRSVQSLKSPHPDEPPLTPVRRTTLEVRMPRSVNNHVQRFEPRHGNPRRLGDASQPRLPVLLRNLAHPRNEVTAEGVVSDNLRNQMQITYLRKKSAIKRNLRFSAICSRAVWMSLSGSSLSSPSGRSINTSSPCLTISRATIGRWKPARSPPNDTE